jgi:hypothetical protein
LAESKPFEIAQPKPLKPEDYAVTLNADKNEVHSASAENSNEQTGRNTLNEEETA